MQNNDLRIEYVPITNLIPAPYNPRSWSAEAREQLKASIGKFGTLDPIIVNSAENRKNIVIGGNFRLATMKELGYEKVPVVYVNIPYRGSSV